METVIDEKLLKSEEIAITNLRSLYEQYGYKPFKMSKFEEYELYVANKDFLVSDRIITFNDTNGRLLALKPDVTLSIIKNLQNGMGKQKLYYNENVYRVSQSNGCFKEIMQVGLECIGDLGIYDFYEVIMLAAKSLQGISESFVMEVSNLSILELAIKRIGADEIFKEQALKFIESKNAHDLAKLCEEYEIKKADEEVLIALINSYGNRNDVIKNLQKYFKDEELKDIIGLSKMFDLLPFSNQIIFDFSVIGNTNYYNGFVFRGFIRGINKRVLSGGQYDKMMYKMSKKMSAIGFAIYLDLLEELSGQANEKIMDSVILYDEETDVSKLVEISNEKTEAGKKILVLKKMDGNTKYRECIDLRRGAHA